MKLHRPSAFGTCPSAVGMAVGAVLMAYLAFKGEAFLRPAAVKHSEAMRQVVRGAELERAQPLEGRWRLRTGGSVTMTMRDKRSGEEGTRRMDSREDNASFSERMGPVRRVRSLIGRKAATAAAVSAILSASNPGAASAAFGRGRENTPSVPQVQEQLLEQSSDELGEAAEGMIKEEVEQALSDAAVEVDGVIEEGVDGVVASLGQDGETEALASAEGSRTLPKRETKLSSSGAVGAYENLKAAIAEKPEVAALAIAGAAGATVLITRSNGSGKAGRRRSGSSGRSGGYAPESPYAGIGQPRVAPEVEAARLKQQEESLKSAEFEVDLELFGDAEIEMPSRPPPPTPPVPEPPISPSEASEMIQEAMAAREESAVGDLSESPPTTVPDDTADTAEAAVEVAMQAAAELPPVEAPETPAAQVEAKQEKKRRGPIMNIFNKDTKSQRATTVEQAISGETSDEAVFRQAATAVLARSAPPGAFSVPEPKALAEASITLEDFEGEAGQEASEKVTVMTLKELSESAGFSMTETAEAVADVVNAMVVTLVDSAVDGMNSKDDASTSDAVDALLSYMDGAGKLFGSLCPGVELSPPIKYNGSARKGKLEKVFEAAARGALKLGDDGQMGKLDRLQDMFSIKEGKANSITQKIMMDLMMKMMSGEGSDGDMAGFEKMMQSMGGGMPGMGAKRSPEEHKQEVEALKAMVESGEVPTEEVEALRKMYSDAGMDLDQLVTDPAMEAAMDEDAKEVVGLLRKLLSQSPKK